MGVIDKTDLKKRFGAELINKPWTGCIMKYREISQSDYYRHVIFVEGSSDRRFYMHTNIEALSDRSYYIYATQGDNIVGKEAVLYFFKKIHSQDDLKKNMEKSLYIVDRDWEQGTYNGVLVTILLK